MTDIFYTEKQELKSYLLSFGVLNNAALQEYLNLIFDNLNTAKEKFKTQRHHSVPVCFYARQNASLKKDQLRKLADADAKNIQVNLKYSDHILAHFLLACCTTGTNKMKMVDAIKYVNIYAKDDAKTKQGLLSHKAELNSLNEERNKIKAEENKNWIGIYKDLLDKRILKTELSDGLKAGGHVGRHRFSDETRKKIGNARRGKIQINDGFHIKNIDKNDLDIYLKNGGNLGDLKPIGYIPGIKGKHHTEETRARMKANAPDRHGINHPMYGKHHTAEARAKISASRLGKTTGNKGVPMKAETKAKLSIKVICIETEQTFGSALDALRYIKNNPKVKSGGQSKILEACRGSRKTAYGFHWRFADESYNI